MFARCREWLNRNEENVSFLLERLLNLLASILFGVISGIIVILLRLYEVDSLNYMIGQFNAVSLKVDAFVIPIGAVLTVVAVCLILSWIVDETRRKWFPRLAYVDMYKVPMLIWDGFAFALFSAMALALVLVVDENGVNNLPASYWMLPGFVTVAGIVFYVWLIPSFIYRLINKRHMTYVLFFLSLMVAYIIYCWLTYFK